MVGSYTKYLKGIDVNDALQYKLSETMQELCEFYFIQFLVPRALSQKNTLVKSRTETGGNHFKEAIELVLHP